MKKLTSWLLAAAVAASLTVPVARAGYTDIPAGTALAMEVQKAVDYGLMNGYSPETFGYSSSMTRAQFAAVLVRMMGWYTESPETPTFTDVPASHYWYATVETAAAHEVIDSGGAFRPGDAITRGEMAAMLVGALGLKSTAAMAEKQNSLPFTDVTANRGSIAVAYAIGMTKGISATTFAPNATATRAQAAAMLVRIYDKLHRDTDWVHGFYAISSHSQLSLTAKMDAVSAGWSRMTWDGTTALLSTTAANGNEFAIPGGYEEVTGYLGKNGTTLNLNVFMDSAGGLAELLSMEGGRAQAIEQIVTELTRTYSAIGKNPYSGVTIDFEGLRSTQKASFTAFLKALAPRVRAMGKSLYVCVSPVLASGSYYDGYDYRAIGTLADKMILMAYDYNARDLSAYVGTEYYKTTAQAPIDQVFFALESAAAQVQDRSKIVLGFSCKNIAWKIDESGKLLSGTPVYPSNETLRSRLLQADSETGWSDTYQCSYVTYTTEQGARYFVWYDDDNSVQAKLNAAKLLDVTGVSLWRLGTLPDGSNYNWNNLLHA